MNIYTLLKTKPHNEHFLKRYYNFITLCNKVNTNEQKYENHHFLPKANDMFPEYKSFKENPWNKIKLTQRQHFIAHWILAKAYYSSYSQSYSCFKFFKNSKSTNSRMYEIFSNRKNKLHSIRMTGSNNPFYGKKHSEETILKNKISHLKENLSTETRLKMSNSQKGKKLSEETKKKLSAFLKGNTYTLGSKASEKTRQMMRESHAKINPIKCPHCEMISKQRGNMNRYHFDNCKFKC